MANNIIICPVLPTACKWVYRVIFKDENLNDFGLQTELSPSHLNILTKNLEYEYILKMSKYVKSLQ